jgi:hypothetical protein
MRIGIETDGKTDFYRTDKPITIDTVGGGKMTVGVFNGEVQVVNITGKKETTMVKFNGKGLV